MNPRYARWLNKVLLSGGTLLGITGSLFLYCVGQMRYVNVKHGIVPSAVIMGTYALMIILFFAVSVSNPGILDKQQFPGNAYNHLTGTYRAVAPQKFLETQINGQVIRIKYCVTCHMYRPPRTVHCSVCGGCVLRYDHHCPYVNNCIGLNNYRKFTSFVSACFLYFGFVVSVGIYRFVGFFPDLGTSFDEEPVEALCTVISLVYSAIILWLIGGLFCFHVVIISKGESTYDRIKGNLLEFNPFFRGCRRSAADAVCRTVRFVGFVNPWSKMYQPKTLYNPGAMFRSQEERNEVMRHNSLFSVVDDMRLTNMHDKNTLRYMQAFGKADSSATPVIRVERTKRIRSNSTGNSLLFADTQN